jgi:hypothetical protein
LGWYGSKMGVDDLWVLPKPVPVPPDDVPRTLGHALAKVEGLKRTFSPLNPKHYSSLSPLAQITGWI